MRLFSVFACLFVDVLGVALRSLRSCCGTNGDAAFLVRYAGVMPFLHPGLPGLTEKPWKTYAGLGKAW